MGESGFFFELLILGAVAAFLIHRLWSVLGRRHGEEQQRSNPFASGSRSETGEDNVVHLPERGDGGRGAAEAGAPQPTASNSDSREIGLSAALTQIKIAEPSFDPKGFVEGAKSAFAMIVEAFADGDRDTLKPLLAPDLYEVFEKEIGRREETGFTHKTTIKQIHNADIIEAQLNGTAIHVTVRFVSDQERQVLDADDNPVPEETSDGPEELVDVWTFSRVAGSPDPNWELAETRTEG